MAELARRWRALARIQRQFAAAAGGIALGVLLLLTAVSPLQLLGALAVALGLLTARFGSRVPDAWLLAPRQAWTPLANGARRIAPRWLWPALVGLVLAGLFALLVVRLVVNAPVTGATAEQLAKGLLGLLMLASLALWSARSLPCRLRESRFAGSRLFRLPDPSPPADTPAPPAEP